MTRLRQRVADRLKGAQNTYAMLTTFNEVDMTALMEMRTQYKVQSKRYAAVFLLYMLRCRTAPLVFKLFVSGSAAVM